jgi:hypothetical protein
MVCPEGAGGVSPGFDPHKRYVNARPLDERMAFVPEGQADRSQARSAWVAMQKGTPPGGTAEVIAGPKNFYRRRRAPA